MTDVHCMIDCETWGTLPNSALRSIAAVTFDPYGEDHEEQIFYCNVDRYSCEDNGLKVDPATERWWEAQPKEARDALAHDPWALPYALARLSAWWESVEATHVWSNGACFDEPIIRVACASVGRPVPWKYWNVRDTRTAWDMSGLDPRNIQRAGPQHHALHDARHQARCVTLAYRRLGLRPFLPDVIHLPEARQSMRPPGEAAALAQMQAE